MRKWFSTFFKQMLSFYQIYRKSLTIFFTNPMVFLVCFVKKEIVALYIRYHESKNSIKVLAWFISLIYQVTWTRFIFRRLILQKVFAKFPFSPSLKNKPSWNFLSVVDSRNEMKWSELRTTNCQKFRPEYCIYCQEKRKRKVPVSTNLQLHNGCSRPAFYHYYWLLFLLSTYYLQGSHICRSQK